MSKRLKQKIVSWFPEYFRQKKHKKMKAFYAQFVKEGDLCFDIGGNEGNRTAVFLDLKSSVIVLEPQPVCLEILKQNFAENKQVTIVPQAVGSSKGEQEMMLSNVSLVSSLSTEFVAYFNQFDELNWNDKTMVELITMDDLIKEFGLPDFCKIDVEGYEIEVLKGLSQAIPSLSFEFISPLRENIPICVELLSALGRYEFNYSTYETMNLELTEWEEKTVFLEKVAQIPTSVLHGDIYAKLIS